MNRRKFIGITSAGAIGFSLITTCKTDNKSTIWRFFSMDEVKVLEAVCEQIIPADEDPGAKDANVVNFIDKQLVTHYKKYQENYKTGIAGVNETSKIEYNQSFEKLTFSEQHRIMEMLESGQAKGKIWEQQSSSGFFNLVREHTMQGFYGSPKHGGNRNYVSYKMLKIDVPIIIGQNRYHAKKSI